MGRCNCRSAAGSCTGCSDSADCSAHEGLGACNADNGHCVECTPSDAKACGVNACNPVTTTCSAFAPTSRATCETCDTDENCADADHFCVPMKYMGVDRPDGYCLKSSAQSCEQPYSIEITGRTTLSGEADLSFCGINENLATCEAVHALVNNQQCAGGNDSECPEGGLCRKVGTLANRCTYACGNASQCLDPVGSPEQSTCGKGNPPGDPPSWCGG